MTARIVVPLVALAGCIIGAFVDWAAFLRSWLTATLLWTALPLGAIAILMTHGLTGGQWGRRSQPLWRAIAATLPLFAVAMLPLILGMETLFPWTGPPAALPEVVQRKLLYLNEPFFIVRTVVYFAIWIGLVYLMGAWRGPARRVSAPGLILWALSLTFFGFDWLMSLEPTFYSDVFGLMLMTGTAASAMAFGLLLLPESTEPQARQDLANLWLALLLGWAFMTFAQLIVIWSGNLPHEIEWYVARGKGYWYAVGDVALLLYLVLPFAVLLSTAAKRSQQWIRPTAGVCLAGHLLYVHWLVLPAFENIRIHQYWLDPAAVITLGAAFLWLLNRGLRRTEGGHG